MKRLLVVAGVMVALCAGVVGCGHYGHYDHHHGRRHYHSDYGRGYGRHYHGGGHRHRPHYRHYDPCD